MSNRILLLLPLFLVPLAAWAQGQGELPVQSYVADPGAGARSRVIDQQRMTAELAFEPERRLVHGTVTHVFTPLRPSVDSLFLDGPGLRIHDVRLNGRPVAYAQHPEGLSIHPDPPLLWAQADTLTITYDAVPAHGLYFTGWDDPSGRARRQIWTQGQGPGHRYWVPFVDDPGDKLVTELVVTFDRTYTVLANGERVTVRDNPDGTRTWRYRMPAPHPGYLMMLGIGRYAVSETTSARGTPIRNYYYPDQPERVVPTYRYTARMLDLLEEATGMPYPWGTYAQIPVANFLHGGMENTTATIFSDAYYVDERAALDRDYVTVNAHELAHQWFGDYVTMGRREEIWLHESFATHYAKRVERLLLGEDHYQWNRKLERDRALADPEQLLLPIRHTRAGSGLVYYKGSLVLDMLADVVGPDAFDRVIREYLAQHAYGNATSAAFFRLFDDVLGFNLDGFFDQWILRGGVPHYRVSYRADSSTAATAVTVAQVHETGPLVGFFRMPINVEVHYHDDTRAAVRAWVDGSETVVRVPNPAGKAVAYVLFDPGDRVLKRLTFDRSVDELAAQALRAEHMIDRYDAVAALDPVPPEAKRAVLGQVFAQEPFPMIRAEVVRQAAGDDESLPLLAAALDDPDAAVRRAVLEYAPSVAESLVAGFERALGDSSYQNVGLALVRLASADPAQTPAYLARTADVQGHDHAVRLAWLETAVKTGPPEAAAPFVDELIAFTAPAYGFRTRVAAFAAAERLGVFDARVAANLLDAAVHFNRRLYGPARSLVRRLLDVAAGRALLQAVYRDGAWTAEQAAFLEPFLGL